MSTQHEFAVGNNNIAGLQRLDELSPPLLRRYRLDLKIQWHGFESRRDTATGGLQVVGLPWIEATLAVIEEAEAAAINLLATDETAPVTVQTYNATARAWQRFNGQIERPDWGALELDRGAYRNVPLIVRDLVYLEAVP